MTASLFPTPCEAALRLGAAAALVLASGLTVRAQIVVEYDAFTDLSAFTLNGSTGAIGNPVFFQGQDVLRLTDGLSQAGSAFLRDPIPLVGEGGFQASFSTAFAFQITDPEGFTDSDGVQGADGIVFVVQTVSDTAGGGGGGIGYRDIDNSLGIEFDTWNNGGKDSNDGNHVGIDLEGNMVSVALAPIAPPFNNSAVWYAWVDYDGEAQVLEVRVSETGLRPADATLSYEVDLPAVLEQEDAFVGFTSGTGGGGGDHDIRRWTFVNEFAPVAAEPTDAAQRRTSLAPIFPNPVHQGAGRIAFQVEHPARVRLVLYDVLGRAVSAVKDERVGAGEHSFEWAVPASLGAGIYILRMSVGDQHYTRRLTLVR